MVMSILTICSNGSPLLNKIAAVPKYGNNSNNNNNNKKKKKTKKKKQKNKKKKKHLKSSDENQENFEAESSYISLGTQGLLR